MIFCQKLNKEEEGLEYQPYPGELGKKIYTHISKIAWQEWLAKQIILINEYRLNLAETTAHAFLEKEMKLYFFNEE